MSKYTLDEFKKAVTDAGYDGKFSDADWKSALADPDWGMSMLQHKKDYDTATTDDARGLAHAQAELLRKQLGYTGGSDGTGYAVAGTTGSYVSPYAQKINDLTEAIKNHGQTYDYTSDPTWQAYQKQYTREGKRATEDAMGAYAAMTGGIPSTAAVTAANQTGQYYAGQLADKIPELQQQDLDAKMNELKLLLSRDDQERSQFNADREYDAAQKQYETAKEQYGQQYDLAKQEFELNKENAEKDWKYQLAVLAANQGDYSLLEEYFGIKPQQAAGYVGGTTGGYSGSGGSGSTGDTAGGSQEGLEGLKSSPDYNSLWMSYPSGRLPADVWAQWAAQYGEEALRAAGFTGPEKIDRVENWKDTGDPATKN